MKNLSLQMTETASLKKSSEIVNKGNVNAENSASAEQNSSFQMMLNKQVQAKQVNAQQSQSRQNQVQKTTTKESASVPVKAERDDSAITAQKISQKASHLQYVITATKHAKAIADTENLDSLQLDSRELTEIDPKFSLEANSSLARKGDDDVKSEDAAISTTDTNLTATTSLPVILLPAILENKQISSSTPGINAELASPIETAAEKQRSLGAEIRDTVLNNALSQGKNANLSDQDAQDVAATGEDQQNHASWIGTMLPNAAKQVAGDDAANTKLMLNAIKDSVTKESAIKEVAMPANYQATAQIKAAEAMQQAGSSNTINAYPGKTGWDQAISQKVVWMLGANEQSATLTLNPPDMGPLQVVIQVHNDKANTTFISDNAEVRQALQDGMANLRDKMSESGIQLGQANVSSGGQLQQQFQQASQQNKPASSLNNNVAESQLENNNSAMPLVRIVNGLVDTFA